MRPALTPSRKTILIAAVAAVAGFGIAKAIPVIQDFRYTYFNPDLPPSAELDTLPRGAFVFTDTFTVHGTPEAVYDALTGDISGWWDHSLSGHPKRMYIEARPGGGFFEMIDDRGNGIQHAEVTYADRGKRLTLDGPLPFTGHPINMLTTYKLTRRRDSTQVVLVVRAAGEVQPRWPSRIERTWRHFIYERFIPYWQTHEPEPTRVRIQDKPTTTTTHNHV